jgi:hypothetical protein
MTTALQESDSKPVDDAAIFRPGPRIMEIGIGGWFLVRSEAE